MVYTGRELINFKEMNMPKILLVEDDPMISEIYQRKLTASGFEVDTAMSASETLSKAKDNVYDLILLDLVLPEMNGMEILKKFRTDPTYDKKIKVVIFSNLSEQEDRDKAVKLGIMGYIEKSLYNPTELVEEVERLLRQDGERMRNELRREKIAAGDPLFDPSRKRRHILFVEDNEMIREIFGKKIRDEGYTLDIAERGDDGMRMALERVYDLVITDMALPGAKGHEIIEQMRKNEATKEVPIFLLSASATDEEIKYSHEMGITEYFLKTEVSPSELMEKVRKLFGEE